MAVHFKNIDDSLDDIAAKDFKRKAQGCMRVRRLITKFNYKIYHCQMLLSQAQGAQFGRRQRVRRACPRVGCISCFVTNDIIVAIDAFLGVINARRLHCDACDLQRLPRPDRHLVLRELRLLRSHELLRERPDKKSGIKDPIKSTVVSLDKTGREVRQAAARVSLAEKSGRGCTRALRKKFKTELLPISLARAPALHAMARSAGASAGVMG